MKAIIRPRGVALIQVLLLSSILTIMLISITASSKVQTKTALMALEKAQLQLELKTAETAVFKALLTHDRIKNASSLDPVVRSWNFDNVAFLVGNVEVKIQDMTGLIYVSNTALLSGFITNITGDSKLAERIVAELEDWQDADENRRMNGAEQADYASGVQVRNGPIQSVEELRFLRSMTQDLFQKIAPYLTVYPVRYLNYMAMPESLLSVYVEKSTLEKLRVRRNKGDIDRLEFSQLTGLQQDEDVMFFTSPGLMVSFTAQHKHAKLSRSITITVAPYANNPIEIWDYKS